MSELALDQVELPDERLRGRVLSEFARTMPPDSCIQAILDHLVERIIEILPITAAGVTLLPRRSNHRYVAASDASALGVRAAATAPGRGTGRAGVRVRSTDRGAGPARR